MDRFVRHFDVRKDADLMFCERRGVAFQRDMNKARVQYDAAYLANYDAYATSPIAGALNSGRCAMVARHVPAGSSVLDIGAASGAFVRYANAWGFDARGFDVIPEAAMRLRDAGLYDEDPALFDVVTYWDSIEHMDMPELSLRRIRRGGVVLVAIPIFSDIRKVRESKHYKPGEHFYYWTEDGFIAWMAMYGFRLLEKSSHETDAGREAIGAFAFCRDLPDGRDYVNAYQEIHATRHYGASATELHLATVAKVVNRVKPKSILDYGCGRSDLVAHFWRDGERRIGRYDPAIPAWRKLPHGHFDLVLACDVMEHIPMAGVDGVLQEIREKGKAAFFTISTKLARARLPDGTNAHCTLLTHSEWVRWIRDVFKTVELLGETSEHELIILAGSDVAMRKAA